MNVRSILEDRMSALSGSGGDDLQVRLATSLKRDGSVRSSMLKRLSSSMRFSYGARAGALKTAARRSGSVFRVDVRQRVIVKALVSRHLGKGMARAGALAAHVSYLGREGAGHEGEAGMEDFGLERTACSNCFAEWRRQVDEADRAQYLEDERMDAR
ncbi:hypothetical protein ACIQTU_15560 [Brevundimonas sp. NPDC090276]|uniref:hypothetical protein n=1 Tax=Brevundimonas sp. NPDC090276 TaxID=3363956 RepID=UPI003839F251